MHRFIFAPLALVAVWGTAAHAETPIPGIDGTWESLACEVRPQVGPDGTVAPWWLTRRIVFEDSRIAAEFTTYGDAECSFALNTLSFAGKVEVVGDSAVYPGAREANLTIDEYVRITPRAQGFADFLNSGGSCGSGAWEVGTEQDILASGCAMLGVEPNTPTVEYEILAVDGDHLYFGARKVDGTFLVSPEDRPTSLLVPARRVE